MSDALVLLVVMLGVAVMMSVPFVVLALCIRMLTRLDDRS